MNKQMKIIILIILVLAAAGFIIAKKSAGPNNVSSDIVDNASENVDKPNSNLVGADRDEHGCIGSAGYSWCEPKNKCLRIWEENCYESVEQEIQYLLAQKYQKNPDEAQTKITKQDDSHAMGSVSFGPEPGEGGLFLAVKQGNIWEVVYDGNGSIDCENIKANYKFPAEMLIGFCD